MDLKDFNWEANPDQLDFFGVKGENYQEQVLADKAREPKSKLKDEETIEELEETEEKQPVFESFSNDKTEESSEPNKEITKDSKKPLGRPKVEAVNYVDQFNSFKSQGILKHMELEEDVEDLDEDTFKDLLEQDYEEEVGARIEQWAAQELDEDAQAFIKFKKNGGRTSDFFKAFSNSTGSLKGNIEDEKFQDKVIRKQLTDEGWDSDEIEDRLEYFAKTDKKQTIAEKYYSKMEEKAEKEAARVLKEQENLRRQQIEDKLEFSNTVKETLNSMQEVKGLKITPKDRSSLYTFITKENQKVGNRTLTGFQKAYVEAVQDPEKLLAIAKLLQTDFDMSDFEKKAKLQETKKIRENLESRKGLRPTTSSSSLGEGKSLADLF